MISTIVKAEEGKDLLALLALFMSSFTMAVAIYESSKRYDARSELFLRAAMEIQSLRDRAAVLVLSGTGTWDTVSALEAEYSSVLTKQGDNHSHLDFDEFRKNIGKLRKNQFIHGTLYWLDIWLFALLASISPAIVYALYRLLRYYAHS